MAKPQTSPISIISLLGVSQIIEIIEMGPISIISILGWPK